MSNLGNKNIMAKNIKRLLNKNNKNRSDLAQGINISYSTVSEWINANAYPRIDKIEMMANYFGVSKSELVEEYQPEIETSETEDISTKLEKMMKQLSDQKEALMFRGEPMDDETKEAVWLAMQQAMKFAEMSMRKEASKKEE